MSMSYPYTLKINNTDFSTKVQKYSYKTSYSPVYSDSVSTMDKIDHSVICRWRHSLEFTLNPMSEADLHALHTALSLANITSVKFTSLQLNDDVTCNMVLDMDAAEMVLKNASRRVIGPITLTFTEM